MSSSRDSLQRHLDPEPLDEHIRVRAYYLFLQRNGQAGDPIEDWLRAEGELIRTGHARRNGDARPGR